MTSPKQPVILTVLIESQAHRWYLAGLDAAGNMEPLLRSQAGDLTAYVGEEFDEQVSFLRHRLSGVLQRGCDRLWGREEKPCQFVFVVDSFFPEAPPELTQRVADHFVEWMTNPPVTWFVWENQAERVEPELRRLAGQLKREDFDLLRAGLPHLLAASAQEDRWEVLPNRESS